MPRPFQTAHRRVQRNTTRFSRNFCGESDSHPATEKTLVGVLLLHQNKESRGEDSERYSKRASEGLGEQVRCVEVGHVFLEVLTKTTGQIFLDLTGTFAGHPKKIPDLLECERFI